MGRSVWATVPLCQATALLLFAVTHAGTGKGQWLYPVREVRQPLDYDIYISMSQRQWMY